MLIAWRWLVGLGVRDEPPGTGEDASARPYRQLACAGIVTVGRLSFCCSPTSKRPFPVDPVFAIIRAIPLLVHAHMAAAPANRRSDPVRLAVLRWIAWPPAPMAVSHAADWLWIR